LQIIFEYAAAALPRLTKNSLKNPTKAGFRTGLLGNPNRYREEEEIE